jgi:hypothetical protein
MQTSAPRPSLLVEETTTYTRERPRDARGAKHGEGEYKDHDLGASIESATQDIVEFPEPSRVVSAQPELRHHSDKNGRRNDRVHAGALESMSE